MKKVTENVAELEKFVKIAICGFNKKFQMEFFKLFEMLKVLLNLSLDLLEYF